MNIHVNLPLVPLCLLVSSFVCPVAAPASKTSLSLALNIRVYNLANVPSTTLSSAQQVATTIYRAAAIDTTWQECPCSTELGPNDLLLRIVPKLLGSMRADFRDNNLGFAAVGADGGVLATIFYHRVEALTRGGDSSKILGHAIAHEIGHLLLGSKAHTETGIMRGYWSRDYLKLADRGLLLFTQQQIDLMHIRFMARASQPNSISPDSCRISVASANPMRV